MFEHQHYVPLMRMKPAELRALRALAQPIRSRVTPMLECPPRVLRRCETDAKLEQRLDHIVAHLAAWAGRRVFLDFSALRGTMPQALEVMAERAVRAGIRPVLVVSLKTGADSTYAHAVQRVLARCDSDLCLRISPEELKCHSIGEMVDACLKSYATSPTSVDLVIDRGGVDSGSVTYEEFAHLIPSVDAWRTLTVLAGSFPEDLSQLAPRKTHRLRRFEWRQWKALTGWHGRRPAFGDYSIQYVVFKEPVAVPNFSASIRYTVEDEYFVLRGEGVLNEGGPGFGQWNAWAALLVERSEFLGAAFSAGDGYIAERATDWRNSGSAQSWLQAAFSHHLTITALQVAGRLDQVRRITTAATAADWASVVDIDRPEATL